MAETIPNSDTLSSALLASKSILARLLASENIVVEHQPVETAMFNVEDRVLTLPMWKDMTNELYDMLVGHEVAHALYTPAGSGPLFEAVDAVDRGVGRKAEAKDCLNIVEDARIERLMKDRFPGLIRDFADGYKTLHQQGIFAIEGDVADMNLADRINVHFKIGHLLTVPFDESEQDLVDRITAADSWDDVVDCSRELFDRMGESVAQSSNDDMAAPAPGGSGDNDEASEDAPGTDGDDRSEESLASGDETAEADATDASGNATGDDGSTEFDSNESTKQPNAAGKGAGENGDMPSSIRTAGAMDKAMKDMADMRGRPRHYLSIGKLDVDAVILRSAEVESVIDSHRQWERFDHEVQDILRNVNGIASNMAKRFEMKQAAKVARRAAVAKTGVLDTVRMMSYKFNDDIFRRNTILPKGKNHGMVMMIDWSGSMSDFMSDTLKQAMYMAAFCRKIGIPFAVYGFSSRGLSGFSSYGTPPANTPMLNKRKHRGEMPLPGDFSLIELVTSDQRQGDFKIGMRNMARMVLSFRDGYRGRNYPALPVQLHLGSTPLNHAIVATREIADRMRARGVEILNLVFLTDGCSNTGPSGYRFDADGQLVSCWESTAVLVSKSKRNFVIDGRVRSETTKLLDWLRDETNARVIGFYLTKSHWFADDKAGEQFTKERFAESEEPGYDNYFVLNPTGARRGADAYDKLDDDASARKAATAFIKQAKALQADKNLMNQFAELVAQSH